MILGHYAASFAAKAVRPNIPLWHLILAAQLIDFAWSIFILISLERGAIVEGFTVQFPFDFYYMPFSHSLPALAVWCAVSYWLYLRFAGTVQKSDALVVVVVVASHWFLDLIVHPADLDVYPGLKVGFGLWNYPLSSALFELTILVLAVVWYGIRVQIRKSQVWYINTLIILSVIAIHFFFYFRLNPTSIMVVSASVLISYTLVTWIAWWYEKRLTN